MFRAFALLLTVMTGFTGLVYEVTWQKYFAAMLGSHSEATAAVLGIFLAGLAVGYAVFGGLVRRVVRRESRQGVNARLIAAYGIVEALIGAYAFVFPSMFHWVHGWTAGGLGAGATLEFVVDVVIVGALLAPPTVLMGATIPLLTQALSLSVANATRWHALIYGFNTLGAFVGALAAAFVLIPTWGLSGVMFRMGAVNLAVGAAFVLAGRLAKIGEPRLIDEPEPSRPQGLLAYCTVALLTGFAAMVLQNVAVRLGGLALGASEFTFASVVAVFVLCIAVGSFVVSMTPRIRARHIILNQCALVAILTILYSSLSELPYWAHLLRIQHGRSEADFYGYYLSSFIGLLSLFGPAAVLSGAVLPLIFHQLKRQVGGLGSVAGRIYSWNTAGSLLGALLGGYFLLLVFDLNQVYRIAIVALAAAAVILVAQTGRRVHALLGIVVFAAFSLFLASMQPWNPEYLSLGLFRQRVANESSYLGIDAMVEHRFRARDSRVIFHRDDPIATVAVTESKQPDSDLARSILTNGKSDGGTRGDYPTMALAALIPSMLSSHLERSFVVGYGTGVTAAELASLQSMKEVVVAEISPGVIEAAPLFDFANADASRNPKVRLVQSDAFRALTRSSGLFDIIVSEPSNPWVTGVEMLYSAEFLRTAHERMAPGGVYAQWYHQYETDDASIALVLRTFASVFDQVAVWYALGPDLLVLGFKESSGLPSIPDLRERMARPDIKAGLVRAGINSLPHLLAHELIPVGVIHASQLEGPIHTLYRPLLNHQAAMAFFRGDQGRLPRVASGAVAAIGARNSVARRYLASISPRHHETVRAKMVREACVHRRDLCAASIVEWSRRRPNSKSLKGIRESVYETNRLFGGGIDRNLLEELSIFSWPAPKLTTGAISLEGARGMTAEFLEFYQHPVPFDPRSLLAIWKLCEAPEGETQGCVEGLRDAEKLQWTLSDRISTRGTAPR